MQNPQTTLRITDSLKDKLTLILPLLWIGMIVFVYMDLGFVGMYLSVIHGMINALLGLTQGEKVDKRLFFIFVIGWGVLMFIALTGMIYYYYRFGNEIPTFTILGMHPSAFYFYGICWIGNLVYLAGLLFLLKDVWLPEERWNAFVHYASSLNNEPQEFQVDTAEISSKEEVDKYAKVEVKS